LDNDILAVYAYEKGFVNQSFSRQNVVSSVSTFIKQTGKRIPRKCNNTITDQISAWLVGSEKIILGGNFSPEKEEEVLHDFKKYVAKGELCDLDREAVLNDEDWIGFFQELGRN